MTTEDECERRFRDLYRKLMAQEDASPKLDVEDKRSWWKKIISFLVDSER